MKECLDKINTERTVDSIKKRTCEDPRYGASIKSLLITQVYKLTVMLFRLHTLKNTSGFVFRQWRSRRMS